MPLRASASLPARAPCPSLPAARPAPGKERENSPFSLSTKQNGPVFQNRKTNAVFLFCFPSAMVLLAAGASPGAAPCNTPPLHLLPPFNPKAGRAGWRGQIKSCRSSETLPLCWSKSATTRTCVKVVRLARWQDDDLSVTTHGVCKAAAPIARARAGNTRRCRPIAPSPVKKPRCRARDVPRTHSRLVCARV